MNKIKKQIKRSFPLLIIFGLLSSLLAGLVFNINLNFKQDTEDFIKWTSEVQADTATTEVTVKNAPPAFTVNAAENPISSSTSPVNVGGSISFTATANDPEDNDYYLIICSSDSIIASSTGGAPSCGDTQFCVSALTGDTTEANCTYSNVADPGAETDDWYAFVCDDHSTESACSSANQGTGDSGNPIYINHAPSFDSVSTTDDNKDPGGTFTIEAVVTDSDTEGGVDELYLYVCSTNNWATSTGCAATTICSGTSTSPNISCQYVDTAPTADQDYTYYAFIKDWHEMPASGNSKTNTYTINNVAPTVSNVVFNNGNNITLNIKNAAEVVVYATSTSVVDQNGCTDLSQATSTVYLSSVTGGAYCDANDNNCYHINSVDCVLSECSGDSDSTATYVCSTSLAYHAIPTIDSGSNPYSSDNWMVQMTAFDEALNGSATTSPGVEIGTTIALEVNEATIDYGIIEAGQNSGSNNATTTIINYGNSPLDNDISGTDMTKGADWFGADNQEYSLNNFSWGTGTDLSSTTPVTVDIITPRPTDSDNVYDLILWGIGIPSGQPSGDYGGINTFSATLDGDGNWN